jgi:hypothetical protein
MQYIASALGIYCITRVYKIVRNNTVSDSITSLFKNPKILYDNTCYYIESLKELHQISSRLHPNSKCRSTIKTAQLLSEYIYEYLSEYMNTSIEHIDKRRLYVKYIYNKKEYRVLVNIRKNPVNSLNILSIKDEKENDVTDDVLKYYGPAYDLHNQVMTPGFIGYKFLVIEYIDDYGEDNKVIIYENDFLPSSSIQTKEDKKDHVNMSKVSKDDQTQIDYVMNTCSKIKNSMLSDELKDQYCLIFGDRVLFSSTYEEEAVQKYEEISKNLSILFYKPRRLSQQ